MTQRGGGGDTPKEPGAIASGEDVAEQGGGGSRRLGQSRQEGSLAPEDPFDPGPIPFDRMFTFRDESGVER